MNKRHLILIFAILAVVVIAILANLIHFASDIADVKQIISFPTKTDTPKNNEQRWIDKMAQISSSDYNVPINELYLEFKFADRKPISQKEKVYKLEFDKTDEYSLFCVTQTLRDIKIPYMVQKNKASSSIHINTNNIKEVNDLVLKLKEYNIQSNIKEVWL